MNDYPDLFESIEPRLVREFRTYHADNPHVYEAFRRFAFQAIGAGRNHIGAKLIIERIRWDTTLSGKDDFKMNNNYPAFYARLFMREFPNHIGFFRTRESVADQPRITHPCMEMDDDVLRPGS